MRTFKITFLTLAVLAFSACKHKQKMQGSGDSGSSTTTTTSVSSNGGNSGTTNITPDNMKVDQGNVRLLVSFISIGAGTDYKTKEKYDEWINGLAKKPAFDQATWGREGEVDYCFPLTDLSPTEVTDFVNKTKEMMKGNSLVLVSENVPCSHKR